MNFRRSHESTPVGPVGADKDMMEARWQKAEGDRAAQVPILTFCNSSGSSICEGREVVRLSKLKNDRCAEQLLCFKRIVEG